MDRKKRIMVVACCVVFLASCVLQSAAELKKAVEKSKT